MKNLLFLFVIVLTLAVSTAAQTSSAKLEGQIVCCRDCWAEADRRVTPYGTPTDRAKAANCIAKGDPTLLAVLDAQGATTFYQLANGRWKRPGKTWLELVGKRVEISGPVRAKKEHRFVRVDELKILAEAPAGSVQNLIGTEAELALKDLSGVEQKLSAWRGRVVVLNFWATWCGPCRKEMPDLAAIQNQYAALGVQVIGAAADTLEARADVLKFIRETKVNFPVWLGATTAEMARFGLGPELPGTAIIGRDGKIVWLTRGVVSEADLKKQLDTLIARAEAEVKQQIAKKQAGTADTSSVPS